MFSPRLKTNGSAIKPMILLDTHVWWWAISEPGRLSKQALQIIEDTPSSQRCVASISLWEFAMMAQRGRILLTISPQEWLQHALDSINTRLLHLSADIAVDTCNLPGEFHKDPADRLIVASCLKHGAPFLTLDQDIKKWGYVEIVS